MPYRDRTTPWNDYEFIRAHRGQHTARICYRASRDKILRVAVPGSRSYELHEFFLWATTNGWKLDMPLRLHEDVA